MEHNLYCTVCGQALQPGMQFCIECGTKVSAQATNAQPESEVSDIQVIKNSAHWTIMPNMIGRRISPQDFENLKNITGIVIQGGVAAFVYVDGKEERELHGGSYDFIPQEEIDRVLESKSSLGFFGETSRLLKALGKLLTGKKVKDQIDDNNQEGLSSIKTFDDIISRLQPSSSIAIYLLSENPFSVVFGSETGQDGKQKFKPLTIRCRHLEVEISLTLQFQITDPRLVITHFLSRLPYITTYTIENELQPKIRHILEQELQDTDINEYGIPNQKRLAIETRLQELSNVLPGFKLTGISDITSSNNDFERLRHIADELFLSEKELEAAIRSNDFRNRLSAAENQVKIDAARNDYELYKALTEIDKDKILHEDELDKFYMLVSRQRKIREATNEEEIRKALQELEKAKLLSQDDMDALALQLADKKFEREALSEVVNMQHLANVELRRMEIEDMLTSKQQAREINQLQHINKTIETKLQGQQMIDDYQDARYAKETARKRDEVEWEMEVNRRIEEEKEKKRERRNEEFKSMYVFMSEQHEREEDGKHRREIEKKESEQAHERTMAAIKNAHEETMRGYDTQMSYEQLLATRKDLDPLAQAALAETVGSKQLLEQERRNSDRIQQILEANNRMMVGFAEKMIGAQDNLREEKERLYQERYNDQRNMAMEYREEKYRAQERQDNYSKHIMEHEDKLQNASVGAINAMSGKPIPAAQPELIKCPNCSHNVPLAKFCAKCGSELIISKN